MLLSITSYLRISRDSPRFPFALSIFLCDAAVSFGQYFSFCFDFSQVMSVMMNLLVKGSSLTLCITSLNFSYFSANLSLWKNLCLSVPSEKQLRFFWDTSAGKFCCVKKFRNDDTDYCKVKIFPWDEITLTACWTISLNFLLFDVPISSWLILVPRPSQIFEWVRLWNKSSIKRVSWKTRFHSATKVSFHCSQIIPPGSLLVLNIVCSSFMSGET